MIEKTASEILKRVKRLQNGDVSRTMQRLGINYGTNYGVSIPQLRQISLEYKADSELADKLLNSEIREAKIIASMLFNISDIDATQLLSISNKADNIEMVEQFSKNLFAQAKVLESVLPILIENNYWQKVLALYSASWYLKSNKSPNFSIIEWSKVQINNQINEDDKLTQKATVFLLQSLSSVNNDYMQEMVSLAEKMLNSEKDSVRGLAQEFLWLNVS